MYKIFDWAGNEIRQKSKNGLWIDLCFNSFDDGEEYLCQKLGDRYDTDRCEYYVETEFGG